MSLVLSSPFPLRLGDSKPPIWTYQDGETIRVSEMGKDEVERALAMTRCELQGLAEGILWLRAMPKDLHRIAWMNDADFTEIWSGLIELLLHYDSWILNLEMELTFLNLEGDDLGVELGESAPPIWITKSGGRIHLRDMNTRHIANAYRLIKKRHGELRALLSEAWASPGPRGEMAALELDQNLYRGEEECGQLGAWEKAMWEELRRRGILAVLDRDPAEEEPIVEGESEDDWMPPEEAYRLRWEEE